MVEEKILGMHFKSLFFHLLFHFGEDADALGTLHSVAVLEHITTARSSRLLVNLTCKLAL